MITDGKIGDRVQCLGVADHLGLVVDEKVVKPRPPWSWFAPHGPPDPRDAPGRAGMAPPYPEIALASGRRAVPVLRALKRASGGRTFTVFLKAPGNGARAADVIWVPEHDRLRGDNVIATLTSPSRLSRAVLDAARSSPDPRIAALPGVRVALVLGGPGGGYAFDAATAGGLLAIARQVLAEGHSLMVTPSRRTPAGLTAALADLAREPGVGGRLFVWRGDGDNPYASILATAAAIIVTADSANMMGEATLTGAPVHAVEPGRGRPKLRRFLDALVARGAVRRWSGRLESFAYEPIDATPVIAAEIAARYRAFRLTGG